MEAVKSLDLTIIHEYGAKRHYEALFYLRDTGYIDEISEVQFNIMQKILQYHDFYAALKNLKTLMNLFFLSNKNIVIGAAPFDPIIPYLIWLKKRHNVIHHSSWPYWNGSKYPKKIIYPCQKMLWEKYVKKLNMVTVTETAERNIERLGAVPICIPHSVNTQIFRPTNQKSGKYVVLYVGRLIPEKGVGYLLNLANKWGQKDVEFWFVGDGELKEQIEIMQKKYSVRYFPYITCQENLAEIYRKADVLVLPASITYEELFGIVLVEAMASSLPVIAANSVGPSEIIDHGVNGFLVPKGNEKELENSLSYLLENPEIGRKMGSEGRRKALKKYAIANVAKLWQKEMLKAGFQ
jgi:glycosyltransferase involved in cell wall biosynthesis